jgi:type I restriction enzyme, S subunit
MRPLEEAGEWPCRFREDWATVPFDQVFLNVTDSSRKLPRSEYLEDGNYVVIDQGRETIFGHTNNAALVYKGELPVIVFGDHTRAVKFVDFPFVQGADGVKVLRPKAQVLDPSFAYQALLALKLPDKGYSRHFKFLRSTVFPVPPLNEQRRIVARIEDLTVCSKNAKEALAAIPPLLEKFRQSVLAAAFRGDLTAKWRAQNPDVEQVWHTASLKELVWLIDGDRGPRYPKQEDYSDEGPCLFLSTKNVRKPGFLFKDLQFISNDKHLELRAGTLKMDDVVVTTRGTLGNVAVFDQSVPFDLVRINSGMLALRRQKESEILPHFLCYCIVSPIFTQQIEKYRSGSAQPQLPAGVLGLFQVPLPNIREQDVIVNLLGPILAQIADLGIQYSALAERLGALESAVLDKAFSGQLVPQYSDEEPASVLLRKLLSQKAAEGPKQRQKSKGRGTKMIPQDKEALRTVILQLNPDAFDFEALRNKVSWDYESLKRSLFELLEEPSPIVRQFFDEKTERMLLKRTSK